MSSLTGTGFTGMSENFGNNTGITASQVLHEAITDLYLQVKVRSNDEVSTLYIQNAPLNRQYKLPCLAVIIMNIMMTS